MRNLIEQLEEAKRQSEREFVRSVLRRGVVPAIDPDEHPKRRGLEGPFRFRSGWIGYYDPREGKYYDAGSDRYLSTREAEKLTM